MAGGRRGGAIVPGLGNPRLDIGHEQAFLDFVSMENPSCTELSRIYKGRYKYPPSLASIFAWSRRHKWVARITEFRARSAVIREINSDGGMLVKVDAASFIAKEELRAMAAHLIAVIKEATGSETGEKCREILQNSQNIARLAEVAIRCLTASEEMMSSVDDKKAEESVATVHEHEMEAHDQLAAALYELNRQKESGVQPN